MKKCFTLLFVTLLSAINIQAEPTVLAFSGSTREGSYNKLLIKEAALIAQQQGAKVRVIDLKDYPMPYYDEDLEARQGMPGKASEIRQLMINSNVIIIASPEYNASVSAVLKNALDWASRGENGKSSRDAFKGKKFVLLSASPGRMGGSRGLVHLKAIIEDVGGQVVSNQLSLPAAYQAFDEQKHLKDPQWKEGLQYVIQQALN